MLGEVAIERLVRDEEAAETSFSPQTPARLGEDRRVAVMFCDMGHPQKTQFTVFGDTVNVASRVEGLNKRLGTRVLASWAFVNQIAPFLQTGQPRRVRIANRWEVVHEMLSLRPPGR